MRRLIAVGTAVLVAGLADCAGTAGGGTVVEVPEAPATTSAHACPTPAQWETTAAPTYTADHTPINTPQAEELAHAIRAQGEGRYADVYGSSITDYPVGRVALCVTDPARGRALAQAALSADPAIDLTRLDIYTCRYPERVLTRAMTKIAVSATIAGFPIYTAGVAPDASGVQVTTNQPGARSPALRARLQTLTGGIAVTLTGGIAPVPASGQAPSATAPAVEPQRPANGNWPEPTCGFGASDVLGHRSVPPAGFEPAHPPPEGALAGPC